MQCAACGSTLPAAGAACPVCDPWAASAGPATPADAVGLPSTAQIPMGPATYLGSALPRWYRQMIRRNPPAPTVDLDAAWRRTVVSFGVNFAVLAAFTITSIATARSRTSAAYQHSAIVMAIGAVVALVVAILLRGSTWLGRVIALLGSRPDLGYARLLEIPQMSRLNALYSGGQSVAGGLCIVFLIVVQRDGPGLLWVPFLGLLILTCCQFALLAAARRPVARLLASPPTPSLPPMPSIRPPAPSA